MGCDIHVHFECKINGKWEYCSSPHVNRWYAMFGKMAGVRCDDPTQITEQKGLPEDVSGVVKIHAKYWGGDGHSHSWFNLAELAELNRWCNERYGVYGEESEDAFSDVFGYFFGNNFLDIESWPEGIEDVRMIFWFDN